MRFTRSVKRLPLRLTALGDLFPHSSLGHRVASLAVSLWAFDV